MKEPVTKPFSVLRVNLERYGLRWRQTRVGARVLLHVLSGRSEPKIFEDRDFGNLRDKGRQSVRVAHKADEALGVLRECSEQNTSVNVGGSLHSSNGHTLSASGLRLVLDGEGWAPPRLLDDGCVDAPGPMKWGALEHFLRGQGRASPVLTDHLRTSVAGTLSVGGGIGPRSVVAGRQLDQVKRIRLLLPNGEARWVSADESSDLFRYCLGGQGTLGILDRVVLRTIEHRPFVTQFKLQFRSLAECAEASDSILDAEPSLFSHFEFLGPIFDSSVVELTVGIEFRDKASARARMRRLPRGLEPHRPRIYGRRIVEDLAHLNHARSAAYLAMLTDGRRPHVFLWNDFFFPDIEHYVEFLRYAEREAMPTIGNRLLIAAAGLAYATFPDRPESPLSGLLTRPGARPYSVGFYYNVPAGDTEAIAEVRRLLDHFQSDVPSRGGRLYRYGYSDADADELRRLYGRDYERLQELRAEVDPAGILNPDVLR